MSAFNPLRQVLYVEDQPINVLLMEALFRQRPELRLMVATSCSEACALAPRIQPELLLLDLRLPDGNGHELLSHLRQQAGWCRLGAIAVTAEPGIDPRATNFDEVWHKPLDFPLARRRLDKWLPPPPSAEAARHAKVSRLARFSTMDSPPGLHSLPA